MVEKTGSLAGVVFFKGLGAAELEPLASACTWRRYQAGQQILGHHEDSTDVFFVVAGSVRAVIFSPSGKEVSFGELAPGSTFGEIAAVDGRPRSASVVAQSEALIASLSAEAFRAALTAHPELAERLLRQFAELIRRLSTRVFEFSVLAVKNRIHAELLRLARRQGGEGNRAVISPAPTHSEIASRVSSHREAVTRELNALAKEGLIERGANGVVVTDLARLARMVEEVAGE